MNDESIRRDYARREYLENNRQPEHRGGTAPRCTDGAPETHCDLCCEPLPELDGECADPECRAWGDS